MEPINKSKAYLKEYSCYHFMLPPNLQSHISKTFNVLFYQNHYSMSTFPSVLIDQFESKPILYLLNWKSTQTQQQLYIKSLQASSWINITFNLKPDFILIFSSQLFIIADKELCIINLSNDEQHILSIDSNNIIHVHPTVVSYQTRNQQIRCQPGIGIIFKDNKNHFYSYQYSINKKITSKSLFSMPQMLIPKRLIENNKLELIVPNHIGLIIKQDQFFIYNLQQMKIQYQTATSYMFSKIKDEEQPIIRWRQHKVQEGYDLTFIIMIGIGQRIQIFFISFKYTQLRLRTLQENINLNKVYNHNVIDWNNISIKPYQVLNIDGKFVVDMTISQNGIVYLSKNNKNDVIGNFKFVDIASSMIQYEIISKDASIWRQYKQQILTNQSLTKDRYFLPNRYHCQFLLQQQQRLFEQEIIDSKILFYKWLDSHKFIKFMIYQEEIVIIRQENISVLRQISQQIFDFQNFTQQNLQKLNQKQQKQSNVKLIFQTLSLGYEEPLIHGQLDQQIYKERLYIEQQNDEHDIEQIQQNQCNEYFHEIKEYINSILQRQREQTITIIKIKQFHFQLFLGQFYDRLNYYQLIVNKKVFKLDKIQQSSQQTIQRQNNKEYQYNIFFIKLINYFYNLTRRPYEYYKHFNKPLLEVFFKLHQDLVDGDIDGSIDNTLKLLLQNLMPTCISNYKNSVIYVDDIPYNQYIQQNSFIQFIINELKIQYEKNCFIQSDKTCLLRLQLCNIINIGFFQCRSIYFTKFQRNQSLFRALILANNLPLISKYFAFLAMRNHLSHFLDQYAQLKLYISKNTLYLIENILFYTYSFHSVPINLEVADPRNQNQSNKKYMKYAIQWNEQSSQIFKRMIMNNVNLDKIQSFSINKIQSIFHKVNNNQLKLHQFQNLFDIYFKHYYQYLSNQFSDKKLQFLQRIIEQFINLFNKKVKFNNQNKQNDQYKDVSVNREFLKDKNMQLIKIYNQIKRYYRDFNNLEGQVNGVLIKSDFELQYSSLKKLYFFQTQKGMEINPTSLQLVKLALHSKENMHASLLIKLDFIYLCIEAMMNYNDIQKQFLTLKNIYPFGKQQIKKILQDYDPYKNIKQYLCSILKSSSAQIQCFQELLQQVSK